MRNGAQKLIELRTGGVRWQVLPDYQDLLFGPAGLRLDEWLRSGLAQVVKHGPHRTVYRVAHPQLSFYLKHYRLPDLRAWLRELIRPPKARMEFQRALAVAARRIPTVVPVALGEGRDRTGPNDSFLITRSLEDAEPVSLFLERTLPTFTAVRQTRIRQRLATALGEFVAHLHDAGIVHTDLHAANLLVRLEAGDRPCLYLIDLHAVNLCHRLTWRVSRANLVILNRWFVLRASRADRYRFWRAYCQARVARPESSKGVAGGLIEHALRGLRACHPAWLSQGHWLPADELARDLERRTWRSNVSFWRNRDRRCLAINRYYYRLQSTAIAGWAVRDLEPASLAGLLADPDAPFHQGAGVTLLKDSRSSTVAELDLPVGGVLRRVIYKRFRVTSRLEPWLALLRRSPALRSWVYGHGLRERCLPTPRPLAVFHRRRGCRSYEGYLLTEKIPDAVDLHHFLSSLESLTAAERRVSLRSRIEQVARLVRELHWRHVAHRDLKAANVLVTSEAVWLIDLVGVSPCRRLSRRRCVQNLARLHASFCRNPSLTRTDKLRFLRIYLQWGLLGRNGWKRWWRDVDKATQAKISRNLRNGRPLA